MKKLIISIVTIFLLAGCNPSADEQTTINNFEDCINAGYPAMESYPRQCRVPGGETFVEVIEEPIQAESGIATSENLEFLKSIFAQKYNKKTDEIELKLQQSNETHMRGAVQFNEASENLGIFFAALINDEWVISFDGNGTLPCDSLKEDGFPEEMISDCSE